MLAEAELKYRNSFSFAASEDIKFTREKKLQNEYALKKLSLDVAVSALKEAL